MVQAIEQGAASTSQEVQRQLAFYGGSFTAIPAAQQVVLLAAARPYLDSGVLSSIRLSTRPDAIDDTVLARLKNYCVRTIELGAQSMDERVLELSGRGHTAKDVETASERIRRAGFELILQMMTGLPGDSGKESLDTARALAALHPNGVRIYPTVVVRDTPLYDLWQQGRYREHTVEDAVELCAQILPIFDAAGIPVIRLGLNPTEELSGGGAVAGAYHPALGELVRSRMMLHQARELLRDVSPGSDVILQVPRGKLSQMVGQHRCNYVALVSEFGLHSLKIQENLPKNQETPLIFVAKAGKIE